MGEHHFRMLLDVNLDVFPGVGIVPDLLAVHADREKALERLYVVEGVAQFCYFC